MLKFSDNRITQLFKIQYPIIQGGMVWASGWKLASAVSNAGGLGLIGAGSMYPNVLLEHIQKCRKATSNSFGVNIPLMYPDVPALIEIILREKVPIVFTSAGNPNLYTQTLQHEGVTVVHVVSSSFFAQKAEAAGCNAVVAEGFEAGGHNGKEETTTLVLTPLVKKAVSIPVITAGGIGTGSQMLAAFTLGAEGVQVGSRFVCTPEASSHESFKHAVIQAAEGSTQLMLKKLAPVRLLKNEFFQQVQDAENRGAAKEELQQLLGRSRAKLGMFEGNMQEGELEIGQVSAQIKKIQPASEIIQEMLAEFEQGIAALTSQYTEGK
ncbi:MAG: nitronate monooxygenase [Chitinophagia bacterium]|jgi:enoyl-[acyl-carrier protein] reductase II